MDYFEATIRRLLEEEGYWTKQSFKVELTKEEKRQIGKPSIPRPEIDLIAYKPGENEVLALEVKSLLDSRGVKLDDLMKYSDLPQGRYKLFTCEKYRETVFKRLTKQMISIGLLQKECPVRLGLAAGNVRSGTEVSMERYFTEKGMFYWGPNEIRNRVGLLSSKGYENDPTVLAAKILSRA